MSSYFDFLRNLKKYLADRLRFDFVSYGILVLAIIFPLIVITAFPKLYHASDVDDLWRWSRSWSDSWRNIYLDCERCNYPFLGTFASAGAMSLSGIDNFKDIVRPYRFYLAIFDAVNVVLIYWLLKKLQVKKAPLWAGVIGLLPSSWIGSSVWGQIEGIGQMLLLLTFVFFISFNFAGKPGRVRYYLFIVIAGLLISSSLLYKQLIVFSLLSIGVMAVANIVLYSRRAKDIIASLLLILFSVLTPIIVVDSNLNLRPPFISHLQYIWETGSQPYSDTISSFGINIWILLVQNPLNSSHDVINLGIDPNFSIPIIPYDLGIALFLLSAATISIYFLKYLLGKYSLGLQFFDREVILGFLFHLALMNLSFNLFLTGTHERYLYHFYPFLIVAYLGLENHSALFNRKLLYTLIAGAVAYGLVLYIYLIGEIKSFGQIPFQILSVFHFALFIYLTVLFVRLFKSRQN
jgi:hypothetical protein